MIGCYADLQATGFVDEATGQNRTVPFELMVQGDKVCHQMVSNPLCQTRAHCHMAAAMKLTTPASKLQETISVTN